MCQLGAEAQSVMAQLTSTFASGCWNGPLPITAHAGRGCSLAQPEPSPSHNVLWYVMRSSLVKATHCSGALIRQCLIWTGSARSTSDLCQMYAGGYCSLDSSGLESLYSDFFFFLKCSLTGIHTFIYSHMVENSEWHEGPQSSHTWVQNHVCPLLVP